MSAKREPCEAFKVTDRGKRGDECSGVLARQCPKATGVSLWYGVYSPYFKSNFLSLRDVFREILKRKAPSKKIGGRVGSDS